jgi:hypothetical protein
VGDERPLLAENSVPKTIPSHLVMANMHTHTVRKISIESWFVTSIGSVPTRSAGGDIALIAGHDLFFRSVHARLIYFEGLSNA